MVRISRRLACCFANPSLLRAATVVLILASEDMTENLLLLRAA